MKGDRLQDEGGDGACRGPHLGGWKKRDREGSWLLAGGWICGAPVVVAEGEETALRSAPSAFLHGERLEKASLMVWRGHRKRTGSWAWSWHSDCDGETWHRISKFQLVSGGHREGDRKAGRGLYWLRGEVDLESKWEQLQHGDDNKR